MILPSSHPYIMELYLEYAKLKDLDPVTLKRAAENHSIRNLGISHWKTAEILSNFKEVEYINHLIKAEAGVEEAKRTDLYLSIVRELAKYGRLHESSNYVQRSIARFDKDDALTPHQQNNYFEILLQGV
jgi:DNA polymerase/3'-5' exonuclease PolX